MDDGPEFPEGFLPPAKGWHCGAHIIGRLLDSGEGWHRVMNRAGFKGLILGMAARFERPRLPDRDVTGSGQSHKTSISWADLIERVGDMLLRPARTWRDVRAEPTTARQLYVSYAAILAAIPAVAHVLGMTLVGVFFLGVRYRAPFLSAFGYAACFYLFSLAVLYGYARIIDALAPLFHSEKGFIDSLKLAVYSSTPAWVSGVFLLFPALAPFALLLSLYGFYLFYAGLLPLKGTPVRYRAFYFLVLAVIGLLIYFVIGRLSAFMFPAGNMG